MNASSAADLDRWLESPPPYPSGRGRGILIPAGGHYLVGAWVMIGLLRSLECTLPVEIWHQDHGELTWVAEAIRGRFDHVTFCNIGRPGGPREKGGWQLKAEALARSSFREVLLLDADNQPLSDPTELFQDEGYAIAGSLFWLSPKDELAPDHGAWTRFGISPRHHAGLDSAQLLIDRQRAWPAVALTAYVNRHSGTYWRDLYGDKDTFLLAWLKAGQLYSLIEARPPIVGGSIYHATREGRPCFRHRFAEKWSIKEPPPKWDRSPAAELLRELMTARSPAV